MPAHSNFAIIISIALLAAFVAVAVYQTNSTPSTQEAPFPIGHVNHLQYVNWKKAYNHAFGASEDFLRAQIFGENYNMIQTHNANKSNTWTMKLGPFAHLSSEEFNSLYLGLRIPSYTPSTQQANIILRTGNLNENIDWVAKGAVRRVKDQRLCGSCWAFSATGSIEGYASTTGQGTPQFSEQQLVDCTIGYGNHGCHGGLMTQAFQFVQEKGIVHEEEYPYIANDQFCTRWSGDFKINGWVEVPQGDTESLRDHLNIRPISVSVDASNFQHYGRGVFNDCGQNLNHGVLLTGFDGNWRVKNSWGTNWGEDGYIRLAGGNTCGIANAASYPK